MTSAENIEGVLSRAASKTMESIIIPPLDHAAIARRAERPAVRSAFTKRWLAIGAAAAAIIALLFLPPVKSAIARAARTIITLSYFPSSHKNQAPLIGRTITLKDARAITAFRFVEPRGLPGGYHLISLSKAPAGARRDAVTLRYVSSTNSIGLTMMETAAKPSRKPASCHVLRWVPTPGHAFPALRVLTHGTALPSGFKSIPCHTWASNGTRIQLVDMTRALTPSQIENVIRLTR